MAWLKQQNVHLGKHPFTAAHVETSEQSYLANKQIEQAQLQKDTAKQQKESETSSLKRHLEVSKRKPSSATEQFPPGQDVLELVHDGLVHRKLSATSTHSLT